MDIETLEKDKIDTIKSILPSSYSTFLMVLQENKYFANEDLTAMEFLQKIEAREFDLKCPKSSSESHYPSFYGGSLPLSSSILFRTHRHTTKFQHSFPSLDRWLVRKNHSNTGGYVKS